MKLLVVIAQMGIGGAEAVVSDLARDAAARGDAVTVASNGGWRGDSLGAEGIRQLRVSLAGRRPMLMLRAAITLRSEIRRYRPDLVHAHNAKAALVVAVAQIGMSSRPPLVVTLHGAPAGNYAAVVRILKGCADQVVAVSEHAAGCLVASGLPPRGLRVIENAVVPPPTRDRAKARTRLSLPQDVPVVLCVARLVPQKRHDLLISAWQRMPDDAVLLLAGDGPTRASVTAAIRGVGATDRIRMLGERRDIDWLLAAADLCVLPTDWEGLPISLLEAMAAGVPVVASAVGGVAGTFDGAVELAAPRSAEALAVAMMRVLDDGAYRARLIDAGRELVRSRFGIGRMLAGYREVCDTLVKSRGAAQMSKQDEVGRDHRAMRHMLYNATRPGFLPVMSRKAVVRLRERIWRAQDEPIRWAEQRAESVEDFARPLDATLWDEAKRAGDELSARGETVLPPLRIDLGGGGHYPLLYFLVRYLKPDVVVETGVAAGYSSRAVLSALRINGSGRLYSSDFPYFRLANPERYIGILVEDELRDRWTLRTRGDRTNLPEILSSVDGVDLFHYDSDKPVDGRRFAMDLVRPRLRPGAVVLMDDIQDNDYFRGYVETNGLDFRVFEFDGKYLGALGLSDRSARDAHRPEQVS